MTVTLAAARVNKGLKQSEAAELLGVHENIISKWETGKCTPSLSNILKMLDLYGLKFEEIDWGDIKNENAD